MIHVVYANLSGVSGVYPAVATRGGVQTLSDIVARQPGVPLAAINGGFFWEVNRNSFIDDVYVPPPSPAPPPPPPHYAI